MISKLKDKINKLREERNEERDEFRKEKESLNNKLDKLLSLTQKERVDTNVSKIEAGKYIKQIEQLKVSEAKAKEQMRTLSKENTAYLKEIHDHQKKLDEANEKIEMLNGNRDNYLYR